MLTKQFSPVVNQQHQISKISTKEEKKMKDKIKTSKCNKNEQLRQF